MFCRQCGNEIHNDAVVCTKCGIPTEKFEKKREAGEISQGIIVTGYLLAFVMPLIGGIIGIYAMVKGKPGHGIGMLVLAGLSFFFWLSFLGAM